MKIARKFKDGDRVVPVSKSDGCKLEFSSIWNYAKLINQPFLYITRYDKERKSYILTANKNISGGDFFKTKDLVKYQTDENTAFEMLLNNEITEKEYEKLISTL